MAYTKRMTKEEKAEDDARIRRELAVMTSMIELLLPFNNLQRAFILETVQNKLKLDAAMKEAEEFDDE